MENKRDLAKIALSALLLASTASADAFIDQGYEAKGTYLAAGCKAHGCGSIADNSNGKADMYDTRTNTYRMGNEPSSTPNSGDKMNSNGSMHSQEGNNGNLSDQYSPRGYSSQPSQGMHPVYSGEVRDYGNQQSPYSEQRGMSNPQQDYNSSANRSDYYRDTQPRSMGGQMREGMQSRMMDGNMRGPHQGMQSRMMAPPLTEDQLLKDLSPEGKSMYQSLDPRAKALALHLAAQDSFKDKNQAVAEAMRQMQEHFRRIQQNPR